MSVFRSFWWECAQEAIIGSFEKANAAAALLGTFLLCIVLVVLGVNMDAPTTVTGTLELGVAAVLVSMILAWAAIFVFRFLGAPARLYQTAKKETQNRENELVALKAQYSPKISIFLSPVDDGVQEVETQINEAGKPPRMGLSKWVQVSISCATQAPLEDCEVWLIGVERAGGTSPGEKLLAEDARCKWSQYEQEKSISLQPLRTQRANLFSLYQDFPDLRVEADFIKFKLRDGIQKQGKYLIKLVAIARGAPPEPRSLIFEWHDYNHISLREA